MDDILDRIGAKIEENARNNLKGLKSFNKQMNWGKAAKEVLKEMGRTLTGKDMHPEYQERLNKQWELERKYRGKLIKSEHTDKPVDIEKLPKGPEHTFYKNARLDTTQVEDAGTHGPYDEFLAKLQYFVPRDLQPRSAVAQDVAPPQDVWEKQRKKKYKGDPFGRFQQPLLPKWQSAMHENE